MTRQVAVRLAEEDVTAIDAIVAAGCFASRSDVLRAGPARVLHEEREREIDEAFRRGYGRLPQEDWVGVVGLPGLAAFDRAEAGESL
jgi:Arc/MetJ-type ribon-helix-helix transcriptional regulator